MQFFKNDMGVLWSSKQKRVLDVWKRYAIK